MTIFCSVHSQRDYHSCTTSRRDYFLRVSANQRGRYDCDHDHDPRDHGGHHGLHPIHKVDDPEDPDYPDDEPGTNQRAAVSLISSPLSGSPFFVLRSSLRPGFPQLTQICSEFPTSPSSCAVVGMSAWVPPKSKIRIKVYTKFHTEHV